MDKGLTVPGGPDMAMITKIVAIAFVVLAITLFCTYLMNVRLYTVSETALAEIRTRTFRHIHDLSMLHQQAERRGSLVARVSTDVDQISQFLQWGGVILLVSTGQLVITTIVMATYSWQLTLLVWVAFLPLALVDPGLPEAAVGALPAGPREDRAHAGRGRRERRRRQRHPVVRRAEAHHQPGSTTPSRRTGWRSTAPSGSPSSASAPVRSLRLWPPPAPSSSAFTSDSAAT